MFRLLLQKPALRYSNTLSLSVRWLNLQEFQSKKLMCDNGINVQRFRMAENLEDAHKVSQEFKVREYVIKAQILAGGRGKGVFSNGFKGGVHLTKEPHKVPEVVSNMLGHRLITKQTPQQGVMVTKVMIAEALDIERETYLAILMDRQTGGPVLVASPYGGVDIEEVAARDPAAIIREPIDIMVGITDEQTRSLAKKLGFVEPSKCSEAANQIRRLYELFIKVDCTQIEINPFGETDDGRVVCFDAKLNFDDHAAFRQREIFAMEDTDSSEVDQREVDATKHNLNYIGMSGNIGCLVNGAGLAMATMDIVKLFGGEPANFLDLGGGVNEEQVGHAFRIITSDPQVKCILVNIFGGIVNCAIIAKGITNAFLNIQLSVPLVVRLEGNNVHLAKTIISESGLPIQMASDFADAAQKAVNSLQ